MSSPWASKHCKPDKKTADMSGQQLEALWALSPEKLAIVQADPTVTPVATHSTRGTLPLSMCRKLKLLPLTKDTFTCHFSCTSAQCLSQCGQAMLA